MMRRILTAVMLSATLMSSGFVLSTFAQDQMMKSGDKMMKSHKAKRKPRKHKTHKKSMMKDDKMMKSEKPM